MNNSLHKFIYVITLTCTALFCLSASADGSLNEHESFDVTSKKYDQFSDWTTKFLCMGVTPTADEVRAKRESLNMSAEQAKNGLDSAIDTDKRSNNLMFRSCMNLYTNSINLIMQTMNSEYQGTRLLAKDMSHLMSDFTEETKKRDVEAFWLTINNMRELALLMSERIDAEDTVANIRKKLPAAKNQIQREAEHEVRASLETFATNENDPSFLPKKWIQNLLDTKVNPYIARWNADNIAARNGQQAPKSQEADKAKLHNILD